MLSMPRIVRPDPFQELVSPLTRSSRIIKRKQRTAGNLKSVAGYVKSDKAGRDTTLSILVYI
jgi:hypothetical protein